MCCRDWSSQAPVSTMCWGWWDEVNVWGVRWQGERVRAHWSYIEQGNTGVYGETSITAIAGCHLFWKGVCQCVSGGTGVSCTQMCVCVCVCLCVCACVWVCMHFAWVPKKKRERLSVPKNRNSNQASKGSRVVMLPSLRWCRRLHLFVRSQPRGAAGGGGWQLPSGGCNYGPLV